MLQKIHGALFALALVFVFGVAGFLLLGGPEWDLLDSVYMTVISLTTVGYGETHDLGENPVARIHTILLLVAGYAVVIYASATITAFLVGGQLTDLLRRHRMTQNLKNIKDHIIVCGGGETAHYIIEELTKTGVVFVVIEHDPERADRLHELYGDAIVIMTGDATEDDDLLSAGIQRATGAILVLESDKDTLFATITCRQLNKNLRIIARGVDARARSKLLRAGADSVVLPNYIGGMRIASEMTRPNVVNFLDQLLKDPVETTRFEEVTIESGSELAGKSIAEADIQRKVGMLVIAFRGPDSRRFIYNPGSETILEPESTVVVLGAPTRVKKLKGMGARP